MIIADVSLHQGTSATSPNKYMQRVIFWKFIEQKKGTYF